ncbi:MAG: tocopherol cyclase family protein [Saprospiraceae bacterium]
MNFLKKWKATWNPDMYHGWGKQKSFFEGWYFKIVDEAENHVFAIIPGIAMDEAGQKHAFIQVLDGKNNKALYYDFDFKKFKASENGFYIQIEDNHFSSEKIILQLPGLNGELKISRSIPWPKMLGAPGIMGWYSFVPFMECYHGVVSLHHYYKGVLKINDVPVHFDKGKGYIEKDWGISFPQSWIWMQSNHFESNEEVCVMAPIAHIPWLGSHFIGYIVGFWWEGKLYRFATYTGAKMKASLFEKKVEVAFKDGTYQLELTGIQAAGVDLVSPISGDMKGKVNESMQGKLRSNF